MSHCYQKYNSVVAKVIKDAYLELNKKFNYEIRATKLGNKRIIKGLFELEKNIKNKYYNYLLSLDKYERLIWYLISEDFDDSNVFESIEMIEKYCPYTGKAKKLCLKVFEAFQNYMLEEWNINSINKTESISNSVVRLSPMSDNDTNNILKNNNTKDLNYEELKGNELCYATNLFHEFNYKSLGFKIESIIDNKFIGFIGLSKNDYDYEVIDGYEIYCYILFSERRKKYATNAIELLLKLFDNNKLLISKEDKGYKYLLHKEELEVKTIDIELNEGSRYIDKDLENLGFKLINKEFGFNGIKERYRYTKKED